MSESFDDDYYDCYDEDDQDSRGDSAYSSALPISCDGGDPEFFSFICLPEKKVQEVLDEAVHRIRDKLGVATGVAKWQLIQNHWDEDQVILTFDPAFPLKSASSEEGKKYKVCEQEKDMCAVCLFVRPSLSRYTCGHAFCASCWDYYLALRVAEGKAYNIPCMDSDCSVSITEDFVMNHISSPITRKKYSTRLFYDCIESHRNLQRCPTYNCNAVFFAEKPSNKRTLCLLCHAEFCFVCGGDYHLPCDCRTIRQWWKKMVEDSETMSYMAENTKDCPNCDASIEKNGGCNHLICRTCDHEFCWMCLGAWQDHGNAYYECNKYKKSKPTASVIGAVGMKNVTTGKASVGRLALDKYLFYFQRWKNHEQSLRLEETVINQIAERVQVKVKNRQGSLIDWQFLSDAGRLLLKCRRTLQYTYAFAYYLEEGPNKMLFEHLQADLESGIENLSFSIERAETVDAASLQAQMRSSEFRRRALFGDAANLIVQQHPS